MIKSIVLLIKFGFIGFFNELRLLFKSLSEILISGFDNLNYHIFQPIRLLRFQDIRDFIFSEDLGELLDNENEIINLYKKIKQIGLN